MVARCDFDPETMSREELEELLRLELDEQDPDLALRALEALARCQPEDRKETEAAWRRFETHYLPAAGSVLCAEEAEMPPVRKKRPWLRAASLAATVALAAGMLAVQAGGSNPVTSFARWTTERFTFGQSNLLIKEEKEAETAPPTTVVVTKNSEPVRCDSLAAAVEELGLEGPLVPTWLPEGYVLDSAEVRHMSGSSVLHVYYTAPDGETFLRFQYHRDNPASSGGSSIHEKDDTPVVAYEREGTTYYFLSNNGFESVTWKPDQLTECTISGEVPREDLQRIVDSLYE